MSDRNKILKAIKKHKDIEFNNLCTFLGEKHFNVIYTLASEVAKGTVAFYYLYKGKRYDTFTQLPHDVVHSETQMRIYWVRDE